MKLIADSGSTKTDWVLLNSDGTTESRLHTEGINPVHQREADIRAILSTLLASLHAPLTSIHFYGSGLRPELVPAMRSLLAEVFAVDAEAVEAESDLLGAARALCGRSEGVACILGTGANSCLYDGRRIVQNTPALGYILGDEGSGAVLGRNLLNALYKGLLPKELKQLFEEEMQLTMAQVIERVYRQPLANRWLASLTPFISRHKEQYGQLSMLVVDAFADFLRRNVQPYGRPDLPLSATGSIAWHFQTELAHAASLLTLRVGRVEQSPLEGLVRYHQ